jgi:hypothetical protein
MSPCRLANQPILRFEPIDNVTSRQHAARQRAVWRTSLATGREDESPTTRRFALCTVVASAITTHKSVPNQPPYFIFKEEQCEVNADKCMIKNSDLYQLTIVKKV